MCVCVYVVNFLSRHDSMEVAPIALKFCMDICICFHKNPIDFGRDLQMQIAVKTTICSRSLPKSIGFLRNHIQISMRNFKTIGATSSEWSRDKHRLFFNVDRILTKEMAKFDNCILTPIQGFTHSKIQKANST